MQLLSSLRARGSFFRLMVLLLRGAQPVLVASLRHSEELAIAMDARGFGAHHRRTVYYSRAIAGCDIVVLLMVWSASVGLAVFLATVP